MQNSKQTIRAWVFLIIICLPALLFIYLQCEQLIIHLRMNEKMEQETAQTIRIQAKAVTWYKENKEIIVDGKLFDVRSYTVNNGIAELTGLFDETETRIIEQEEMLLQKQQKDGAGNKTLVAKFVMQDLFIEDPFFFHSSFPSLYLFRAKNAEDLPSADLSFPSPPPKI